MNKNIRYIDLFAGIGGIRLGFEQALSELQLNGECVWSCEINKHACEMYEKNFGTNPYNDITLCQTTSIPDFDVLLAGFPCQPFSSAGKQLGFEDTRGTLFFDICRIIKDKKPQIFILENVSNLEKIDNGKTLNTMLSILESFGYSISYKVLNARDFGVPQNRKRIIIVGNNSNKTFDFSYLPIQTCNSMNPFLDKVSNFEYLPRDSYVILDENYIKTQPSGLIFCGYKKGNLRKVGIKENTEHLSRVHKQPNRIYHCDGIHPTLSSQETAGRYYIKTDQGVRKLTIDECYRIMGFPENFIKIGAKSQLYARIGNSVCVPMIKSVVKELMLQLL
jgi:DNA (cytosine-5)-methyltransferase 1